MASLTLTYKAGLVGLAADRYRFGLRMFIVRDWNALAGSDDAGVGLLSGFRSPLHREL